MIYTYNGNNHHAMGNNLSQEYIIVNYNNNNYNYSNLFTCVPPDDVVLVFICVLATKERGY